MTRIQRLMKLHRLMNAAGDGGSDASGTGTGAGSEGSGQGGGDGGEGSGAGAEGAGSGDGQGGEGAGAGEGSKKPSDAEAKLLKEVMTKKNALDAANTELAQVKEQLKKFEGIDADKVRALLKAQEDAEEAQAIAKGDFERLKKKMAETHTAEKNDLLAQITEAKNASSSLQQQIADLTIGSAFTASKFVTEELIMPAGKARAFYGSHFEFKDGKVVGYDKPAGAADRAPLVDASGEPLPFEDAFKKIIDADPDREALVRSKVKAGAGSGTQKKPGKDAASRDENLTATEKIARGLKNLAKQTGGK